MPKKNKKMCLWAKMIIGLIAVIVVLVVNTNLLLQTEIPLQASTYIVNGATTITENNVKITDIPNFIFNPTESQVKINPNISWGLVIFFNVCIVVGLLIVILLFRRI